MVGIETNCLFLGYKKHGIFSQFFSHAQTVSKQHTTANNDLVILRGSLSTLKKAVMQKRRLIYTAIKRLFNNIF